MNVAFKDVVPIILHVDSDPTFQQLIIVLEYIPVLNFELDFRISLQNYISKRDFWVRVIERSHGDGLSLSFRQMEGIFLVHFNLFILKISFMVDWNQSNWYDRECLSLLVFFQHFEKDRPELLLLLMSRLLSCAQHQ